MRNILLVGLAVFLTGCFGYTALYQDTYEQLGQVSVRKVQMSKVERNVGERRVAQIVANNLKQTFSTPLQKNTINLEVTIEEATSTLAVRRDATDQRLQLNLVTQIALYDEEDVKLFSTSLVSSAAYNVENTPYGTESGRERARASAAKTLSDEIIQRVALFLRQQNRES